MSRTPFDDDAYDTFVVVPSNVRRATGRTVAAVVPTPTKRAIVMARTGGLCAYCWNPADTLDHVVPLSRGGTGDAGNLVACCRRCNAAKGNKRLADWRPDLALVDGRIVAVEP